MNDVVRFKRGEVAKFDPQKTRDVDAQADAVIEYARKVKDWPTLDLAVDAKIEQQVEFVRWWSESVRKGRPKKSLSDPAKLSMDMAEELTGIAYTQVGKWSRRLKDIPRYRAQLYGAAYKAAMAEAASPHVLHNSGENEWYTPPEIIEAARRVMGGIDLDPASSEIANRTVAAATYFTAQDDGLAQKWRGRVWMNPPYAQPLCAQFCAAMSAKAESGEIEQACVLINNATETAWFQDLITVASAVCFPRGRVKFVDPEGNPSGSPLQGQAIIYLGPNARAFYDEFRRMGTVLFHG